LSYLDRKAMSGMSSAFEALEANTQTRIYVLVAAVGAVATVVLWILHLRYPYVVPEVMGRDSKVLMLVLFVAVTAPPFAIVYSLGSIIGRRAGAPAHEASGPMSGYFYRERANKEWKLVMIAGIVGGLNFLLIFITGEPL